MRRLLAVLLLVIWALAACGSEPSAAPTTSGPSIVAFGDSLTRGYGLEASESYPAVLQARLEADGPHTGS